VQLVGHVSQLSITPFKGTRLVHPQRIELQRNGAIGDRQFFAVTTDHKLISASKHGELMRFESSFDAAKQELSLSDDLGQVSRGIVEEGAAFQASFFARRLVDARTLVGPWSEHLSDVLGFKVIAAQVQPTHVAADNKAASLVSNASIIACGKALGDPTLDSRRFRMLIEVAGPHPHEEDEWQGRLAAIGEAHVALRTRILRCAQTTRNPESGLIDRKVLKAILDYRGPLETGQGVGAAMGVHVDVIAGGIVANGDPMYLLDPGDDNPRANSEVTH
jgi:uncharacterized protein YcbX